MPALRSPTTFWRKWVRKAALALFACVICMDAMLVPTMSTMAVAQEAAPKNSASESQRPRIGLVLGGGGARGAAHVGVLKVLEELRIPVDYVAGTSMGSIVGSMYASGMSVAEIEREMNAMNWDDLFVDAPSREQLSFRRKRDDDLYTFKAKLGFNHGKIEIPLAYVRGQKFDLELNRLMLPVANVKDFDQLPIPFRAVAADLETGKEAVLGSGSLAKAVRASLAVPAAFDPVSIDERLLVDGGIANNVPVSVARGMGADVFIVVDVGSGLYAREQITTVLDVTAQLANFLFTQNTERQMATLTARDVLIRPQLGDIGGGSFDRATDAIAIGERDARQSIDSLRRYSLDPDAYAKHRAVRMARMPAPPTVDFVRIENKSRLGDDVIAARISAQPSAQLDVKQLEQDIGNLYGLDIFDSVRYDLVRENNQNGLVITARERDWGPGYLQFGLAAANDLHGNGTYRFGLLYTLTELNRLNGEWRTAVQFGDEPGIGTEIHQPLDAASRYFTYGKVNYSTSNVNEFDASGQQLASYRIEGWNLDGGFGREFGAWGEGRLGYRQQSATEKVRIGDPAPDTTMKIREGFLKLSDDKLDNLFFPHRGHFGTVEYRIGRRSDTEQNFEQVNLSYTHAFPIGVDTLIGSMSGATTLDDNAPLERLYRTGGFLRLSGLVDDQLTGQHSALASLAYLHRLSKAQLFQSYFGVSLEVGNAWQRSQDVSFDNTITAGSLFLGADTPIGPLYFAYGRTDQGDQSVYLYLGPRLVF